MYHEDFRIRLHECDAWGHLNHDQYFSLMQQTALAACSAAGWSRLRFQEEGMLWKRRRDQPAAEQAARAV
ncbi:MAG TPA: hypothetical protein PLM00_05200, partial [Spirochaetota bacterium]|nr:hypothetical protein [Spirochaetota bacterium]